MSGFGPPLRAVGSIYEPEAAGAIGDCAPEGMRKSELQVKNSKSSKLFNEV